MAAEQKRPATRARGAKARSGRGGRGALAEHAAAHEPDARDRRTADHDVERIVRPVESESSTSPGTGTTPERGRFVRRTSALPEPARAATIASAAATSGSFPWSTTTSGPGALRGRGDGACTSLGIRPASGVESGLCKALGEAVFGVKTGAPAAPTPLPGPWGGVPICWDRDGVLGKRQAQGGKGVIVMQRERRALLAAGGAWLGSGTLPASAQSWPTRPSPDDRHLRTGRLHRHRRARPGRAPGHRPRPARRGGQPCRRGWYHRHRGSRAQRPRRPHAAHGHDQHASDERGPLPDAALRPRRGLRARLGRGDQPEPAGRAPLHRPRRRGSASGAGPGTTGQAHLRFRRQLHVQPPGRRAVQGARRGWTCCTCHSAARRRRPRRWWPGRWT